ncbi:uncharacterized protein LOC143038420 [Oratosquilla oratoria]|uniref:uncharacterized protein LOC143038420 n=1 Tax=Oratosquilla oratoria TaxID=337810 RepID=UPI003F759BC8
MYSNKISNVMPTHVAPRLRIVLIRTWKNGKYINEKIDEVGDTTLHELLDLVNRKGRNKVKNDNRRKQKHAQHTEASDHLSSEEKEVWEIKNLKKHKQQLNDVTIKELFAGNTDQLECSEKMKVQDTSLLCHILLNKILDIDLPEMIKKAIIKLRDIRNDASHPKPEHNKEWFKDNMRHITEWINVLSEYYNLTSFAPPLLVSLEDLKEKVDQNYESKDQFINLHYQDRTCKNILSLEKFITENRTSSTTRSCVIALSGVDGSGKSTVVSQLAYQQSKTNIFKLVVLVNEKRVHEQQSPMIMFFSGLKKLAPDLFEDNEDELKEMVKLHMRDILVILDIDANYPKEMASCISEGNWIITTSTDFEAERWELDNLHVLKVKPLDENQVTELLAKLNQGEVYENIMKKYNNCNCKKFLSTPELVIIFSSIRGDTPSTSEITLIQCLYDKKMESLKEKERSVILGLGEQACKAISWKSDYVSDKFKCEEVISKRFLITEEKRLNKMVTRKKFSHTLLRDFLCAKYYVENPVVTFKTCQWVPYLYKRPFKLACYLAIITDRFKQFKEHIELFLSNLFTAEKRKDIEAFQSWGFIFHIDEAFSVDKREDKRARMTIITLSASLIDKYSTWYINCWDLREENIRIFCDIIKKMEVNEEKVITLNLCIDFLNFVVADRLWNALRSLEIFPFKLCVKVNIIDRECLYKKCLDCKIEKNLKDFCQSINERCPSPNLSILEYKGPMLLSKTFDPLGSGSPLKGLVSLKVHVYDIFSLNKLLHCKELESLRILDITLEMSSQEDVEKLNHSFFEQNDRLRISLNIVYYKAIQKLLNKIATIKCLTFLGILNVTMEDLGGNNRIDLQEFRTLKTLELKVKGDMDKDIPMDEINVSKLDFSYKVVHSGSAVEGAFDMEKSNPDKVVMDESMDVTGLTDQEDDNRKRRRDVCEPMSCHNSGWQEALKSQTSILTNILLPERLYCLILNGFRISDASFLHQLNKKRVIITSAKVRVSDIPGLVGESLESQVKRMKLEKDDVIRKKQRFSKEKRDKLRRQLQPRGKEIIIMQDGINEDWSHFIKVEFYRVIRALQQFKGSMFAYKSGKVTFRKDVCEDIRICLPMELLVDEMISSHCKNPSGKECELLRDIYRTLSLVQYITLEETSLSREGAYWFVKNLIDTKKETTEGGEIDPFHLSLVTRECMRRDDINKSKLHSFVEDSKELAKFSLSCKENCCHFRKTIDGDIWLNREKLRKK